VGAKCEGAFFTSLVSEQKILNQFVTFYPVIKTNKKYFNLTFQRRKLDEALYEFIKKKYKKVDFFYIRHPGASKRFLQIFKEFGNKIIIEHQSKELDEIKSLMVNNKFGLKPSKLLSWFQYSFLPYFNEKYYGEQINKFIKASICVTGEIAKYQKQKGSRNSFVITNGISTKNFELKSNLSFGSELNLLFLKGTSGYSPWNGFERLVESIDYYYSKATHPIKINLLVYGHHVEGELPSRAFVYEGGFVSGKELDDVFNKVQIGVSGIQVYIKNFREGTSLKVREYIARGLPFIYAYTDPDLNDEAKEFSLQFPNDDSLIDMEQVIEFAKRTLSDPLLPQKMRKYAEEHLDYEVKMKKLYQILLELKDK
jgi:hypothetical protein